MANVDRKGGFRPVRHLNGNPWNGGGRWYYIPSTDSTAVFRGDAVKSAGSSDTSGKYATVQQAAATEAIRGVVIAFADQPYIGVDQDNLTRSYRPISTAMYCLVIDDPDVIFEIQEDNATNDMDADMVGLSTDIAVGTGDTTTGLSAMELDSSDTATAAGQCKVLGVSNKLDNALGTYCKWDVLIIEHEMRSSTDV